MVTNKMPKEDNNPRSQTGALLDAILAWRPDSVPLEQLDGAREFADGDPERVEDLRLIERLLAKYRKPVLPDNSGRQDGQGG